MLLCSWSSSSWMVSFINSPLAVGGMTDMRRISIYCCAWAEIENYTSPPSPVCRLMESSFFYAVTVSFLSLLTGGEVFPLARVGALSATFLTPLAKTPPVNESLRMEGAIVIDIVLLGPEDDPFLPFFFPVPFFFFAAFFFLMRRYTFQWNLNRFASYVASFSFMSLKNFN